MWTLKNIFGVVDNSVVSNENQFRICIIGAGISGICAAIQVKRKLRNVQFTIFESNSDVGGTWLVNTYPGCSCDVESHLYSFSFDPNPYWKCSYATQPEILNYLQNIARKNDLYNHIQFNTMVTTLTWHQDVKKWRIKFLHKMNCGKSIEQESNYNFIINAPGIFRQPNIPQEFRLFKNAIFHSAEWDNSITFSGNEVVAVVGSGASAVQIIPSIAENVKELHVFQRTAPWILPKKQYQFGKAMQFIFAYFPLVMWLYRCLLFLFNEIHVYGFYENSFLNRKFVNAATKYFENHFHGNDAESKKHSPMHSFGCKRVSLSDDYYKTFFLPSVKLHCSRITKILDDKILTEDGLETQIDILILATGFKVQDYFSPMKIYGKDGEDIYESWKFERPNTYFGTAFTNAPNHFMIFGPNTSPGHNSLVFMIECQVNMAINLIAETIARKVESVEVKSSAQDEFMKYIDKNMESTIWSTERCGSWYENSKGYITAIWPLSCIEFWRKTRKIDFDHFEFQ